MMIAFIASAVLGVVQLLGARTRAVAAADAAALAAAPVTFSPYGATGSPAEEAARFAALNGARLLSCVCPPDSSLSVREVEVRVGVPVSVLIFGSVTVSAESRAEFDPLAAMGLGT
jgi:hypothetical protein